MYEVDHAIDKECEIDVYFRADLQFAILPQPTKQNNLKQLVLGGPIIDKKNKKWVPLQLGQSKTTYEDEFRYATLF